MDPHSSTTSKCLPAIHGRNAGLGQLRCFTVSVVMNSFTTNLTHFFYGVVVLQGGICDFLQWALHIIWFESFSHLFRAWQMFLIWLNHDANIVKNRSANYKNQNSSYIDMHFSLLLQLRYCLISFLIDPHKCTKTSNQLCKNYSKRIGVRLRSHVRLMNWPAGLMLGITITFEASSAQKL